MSDVKSPAALIIFLTMAISGAAQEGPLLEVTAGAGAEVRINENGKTTVLAKVSRGTRLWAFETKGDFYRVLVPNSDRKGWVWNRHVAAVRYTQDQINELRRASSLLNEATQLLQAGQQAAAGHRYEQSVAIVERIRGKSHPDTAVVLLEYAVFNDQIRNRKLAEQLCQRSLESARAVFGPNHAFNAGVLSRLAMIYRDSGRFKDARKTLTEVIWINQNVYGQDHRETANAWNNLAVLDVQSGDLSKAESSYLRALKILRQGEPVDEATLIDTSLNLAMLYMQTDRYLKAEPLLLHGYEYMRDRNGLDHPSVILLGRKLAEVFQETGDYGKADAFLRLTILSAQRHFGKDHVETGKLHNQRGRLLYLLGDYLPAAQQLEQALAISERTSGSDSINTAVALKNLADVEAASGEQQAAKRLLERVLEICGKHPETARFYRNTAKNSLAIILSEEGDYATAARLYREILAEGSRPGRSTQHDRPLTLHNLGMMLLYQERYADAIAKFSESLTSSEEQFKASHPDVLRTLHHLGLAQASAGNFNAATVSVDKAMKAGRTYFLESLPYISENLRRAFLNEQFYPAFHRGLSLALRDSADQKTIRMSAEWLVNNKSASSEAEATAFASRRHGDSDEKRELRVVQQRLQQLAAQPGLGDLNDVKGLNARRNELLQSIRTSELMVRSGTDDWTSLSDLQSELPDDSLFIDIARLPVLNYTSGEFEDTEYVAWVTASTTDSEVRLIRLGQAAEIDQLVDEARRAVISTAQSIAEEGHVAAEAVLQSSLAALSKRILSPIQKEIEGHQNLILSPDGELWLCPWAALITSDGRYLTEQVSIRYVPSGRSLKDRRRGRSTNRPPMIFADPDYASRRSVARELSQSGSGNHLAGITFPRLPASAAEAAGIKAGADKLSRNTAEVLLRDDASEAAFRRLRSPQIVVLSTHGYFQSLGSSEEALRLLSRTGGTAFHPLARCGLALAGANHANGLFHVDRDDGILNGLEISAAQLDGTELVVLSACETGIGDVRMGDGVAGLRHAFQLAGAESVVASLWQVDDAETARITTAFFDRLGDGLGRAEALREAQLSRIEKRRERYGAAHPFFWAAFTLTGQD